MKLYAQYFCLQHGIHHSNVAIIAMVIDISILIFVIFVFEIVHFVHGNNGGGITTPSHPTQYQLCPSSVPPMSKTATVLLSVARCSAVSSSATLSTDSEELAADSEANDFKGTFPPKLTFI